MARPGAPRRLWARVEIEDREFHALHLDHPDVDRPILSEIETGFAVYYDRRWRATERFCRFLLERPGLVRDRSVLVVGAGVGLESVVVGSLCRTLHVNELSPVALQLCARQLRRNGVLGFHLLPGPFDGLDLPPVDLLVGCYVVYDDATAAAMGRLLERTTAPALLASGEMPHFHHLLRATKRKVRHLLPPDDLLCVLLR